MDNSGKGPTYTYTPAGRLRTRTWARGTNTTYTTNAAGDVATVVYGDGTPGITNAYDVLGRLTNVLCSGITASRFYDLANDLLGESYAGGILGGLAVTNSFDSLLRRTGVSVLQSSTVLGSTAYGYDAASRLHHRLGRRQFSHVCLSCQFAAGGPYCLRIEQHDGDDDEQQI